MDVVVQQLANGLMSGSIYGLIAVSVALVFGVQGIPQFALGAQAMLGAYLVYLLGGATGYPLALLLTVVIAGVLGLFIQLLVFEPIDAAEPAAYFLAAAGLMFAMQGVALLIFGPNRRLVLEPIEGSVSILGATLTWHRLLIVVLCAAAVIGLQLYLKKTRAGRAMRATAQSSIGAKVVGLSPKRVACLTMVTGCGMAGLAGGLLAPISQVYPTSGNLLVVKAFVIVAIAGMGSISGALICGYLVGLVESLGSVYFSASYHDIYALALLFVVLVLRPEGLFVRAVRKA